MAKDDDELMGPSYSRAEDWSKADRGRLEQLQRSIKDERGKDIDQQHLGLKTDVELQHLQSQLAGKADEESKRKERQVKKEEPVETFGTKTHKQEEEQEIVKNDEKSSPDKLIKEAHKQRKQRDENQEEYQQPVD